MPIDDLARLIEDERRVRQGQRPESRDDCMEGVVEEMFRCWYRKLSATPTSLQRDPRVLLHYPT